MERIVLGTLLNDSGSDGFMKRYSVSLCRELFTTRQLVFIFDLLTAMYGEGLTDTTPKAVFEYAESHQSRYGNPSNFCQYLCELATNNYAPNNFQDYLKELVRLYISDRRYGYQSQSGLQPAAAITLRR